MIEASERRIFHLVATKLKTMYADDDWPGLVTTDDLLKFFYSTSMVARSSKSAQSAQTSAERLNPVNPDFGLRTPGSRRWSRSSPKLNPSFLGPCPTPPRNFAKIRSQLFQLSDGQTDKQTDKQTKPKT